MRTLRAANRLYVLAGVGIALLIGARDLIVEFPVLLRPYGGLSGIFSFWAESVPLSIGVVLLPLIGKLCDVFSLKKLLAASVIFVSAGSAIGALGNIFAFSDVGGIVWFSLFRSIESAGAAGVAASAFAIFSRLYVPKERIGAAALLGGAVALVSLVLWLSGVASAAWFPLVDLPLGMIALWLIVRGMPRFDAPSTVRLSPLSAILTTLAFVPLFVTLALDKTLYPWNGTLVIFLLGFSVLCIAGWVVFSLRSKDPVFDPKLFSDRIFTSNAIAALLIGGAFVVFQFSLSVYLANVVETGPSGLLRTLPPLLGLLLGAGLSATLAVITGRYKIIAIFAGAIALAGVLLTAVIVGPQTDYSTLSILSVISCVGFGAFAGVGPVMPLSVLISQNSAVSGEVGQAGTAVLFFRGLGVAIAIGVIAPAFTPAIAGNLRGNISEAGGFTLPASFAVSAPGKVRADFDKLIAKVDRLYEAKDDELARLLAEVKADSSISPELLQYLSAVPAEALRRRFTLFENRLRDALIAGYPLPVRQALAIMDANPVIDGVQTDYPKIDLPFKDVDVVRIMATILENRIVMTPKLIATIETLAVDLIDKQNKSGFAAIKKDFELKREIVANSVKISFATVSTAMWTVSMGIVFLALVALFLIPGIPLRGTAYVEIVESETSRNSVSS